MTTLLWRLLPLTTLAALALVVWSVPSEPAAEVRYLRIAAGPANTAGFAGATALAAVVSRPPGLPACQSGEACGVPGVVALAQSLPTADAIVDAVASGAVDSGLVPANAVYGARCPLPGVAAREVRVLGELYDEALHVLARPDLDIAGPEGMKGRRVAVGVNGTEDRRLADRTLTAYGLKRRDVRMVELSGDAALGALAAGEVDVVLRLAAWPDPKVTALLEERRAVLLPVTGEAADRLRDAAPFERSGSIPAGTYGATPAVRTLLQPVLWIAGPAMAESQAAALAGAVADAANHAALVKGEVGLAFSAVPLSADRLPAPAHPGTLPLRAGKGALMDCPDDRRP